MKTKISLSILAVFIVGAGIIMLANRGGSQASTYSSTSQSTQASNGSSPIDSSASAPAANATTPIDSNAVVPVGTPASASAPKTSPTVPAKPSNQSSNPAATSNAPKSFSLAQVAQHNSASSCWSAINGQIYDLTSWINQHPGGSQAILIICGKDGSSAFNDQHGGQRRPANELTGFAIGALAQ
jgi:cytochrome b involved in lipid metabolism